MKFPDTMLAVIEGLGTTTWAGSAIGFVATTAPVQARTIEDREARAKLAGGALTNITRLAYTAGAAAVVAAALRAAVAKDSRPNDITRALAGLAAIGLIAYHEKAILNVMETMRAELGAEFATLAEDDPRRIAYRALHERSRTIYGAALLAGLLEIALVAAR